MSDAEWQDLAAFDDLWEDAGFGVTSASGEEVALFRVGEDVFAIEGMCNHGNARLCDGFVEGHEVECPLHQARFDLRTGVPSCGPATVPVKVYPARVSGSRVLVLVG